MLAISPQKIGESLFEGQRGNEGDYKVATKAEQKLY